MTEPDVEQCDYRQGRQRCLRPAGHVERHRFAPTKGLHATDETIPDVVDNTTVVEPAEPHRPIAHALSRVDNDLLLAWDTCGECGLHITVCHCPNGPHEPEWVKRWIGRNQPGTSVVDLLERRAAVIDTARSTAGVINVDSDPEEGHS